ncbi:MAG: hypothetical protein RIM84_07850 [Alphaproteobacteria bacterium]
MGAAEKVQPAQRPSNGKRFLMVPHDLLNSPRWLAASPGARCLFLDIWTRFNGRNNGAIPYSQQETVSKFGCGQHRAIKWFTELQSNGHGRPLIRCTSKAKFAYDENGNRIGNARLWEIDLGLLANKAHGE